jgi:hypothetical protein
MFAPPSTDTLAEGGIMAGQAGAGAGAGQAGEDQPMSLEDLAKLAEQWLEPEGGADAGAGQTTAEFPEWDEYQQKAYKWVTYGGGRRSREFLGGGTIL